MIRKPDIDEHTNFIQIKKRQETNYIVVHCSATLNRADYDWKTIDRMHREKGWIMCGYHFVIKKDGTIQNGRDVDTVGAHVSGHNNDSVGICLIGGIDKNGKSVDNFTEEQKASLRELIDYLRYEYPKANVLGHRDFPSVAKDCPCFDVKSWYGKGAKYVTYNDELIDEILVKYNISRANFIDFNGDLDKIHYGDTIRVA